MTRPIIAALVVSLPERGALLAEALASVHAQTRRVDHCLVGIDYAGEDGGVGEAKNMNRLQAAAVYGYATHARDNAGIGELWYAFLHDDDLWKPGHIEIAERIIETGNADVIVSQCQTTGGRPPLARRYGDPDLSDYSDILLDNWFVPSMVVARASVFEDWVEAAPYPTGGTWVDWTNWRRLYEAGARIVETGQVTTIYRFGEWNMGRSWSPPPS